MQLRVPPLGESITEATISRWLKREGEAVNAGDTLVELETDKITVEVPALKGGVLTSRARAEGDVVKVGEVLGEFDDSAAILAVPAATAPAAADLRAAPSAARLAADFGFDLSQVAGSGRGGVISKPDVLAAMSAPPTTVAPAPVPAPAPVAPTIAIPLPPTTVARPVGERETREKMTTRRKRIAENLLHAQHATAHLTTFNEIDMSAITALRDRMKEKVEKEHGLKLSFMPFFAKAACLALKAFPTVNAQIDGESIIYKHYVNLGIAVSSDAGLVVPNLKDADRKGILDISRDIIAVAKKARDGKLTMDDLTGGSFTVTNGGVFGSLLSTPIINYPQVAILGLHKTQDRPVAVNGEVAIRPMMYIALSYDHRIVDGQQAVLFLVRVKELMEDPATMLID